MSNFTEADIPVDIKHGETITLSDGTTVRFDSNGEAKDVMLNDDWSPAVTLFPGNDFELQAGGKAFKLTCGFDDSLRIEKV
ncbi:MAG: hypothetical protein PHV85_01075 [Desulfovibrionaceae bacterium]|nr:hypothetical protein [Desulfovibrionaceae bacterium]MDD4951116.1 hypothetical protein [Desulfovibrionaceae bacterium]